MPPASVLKVLQQSPIEMRNIFGPYSQLQQWTKDTKYFTYIPITYHWNKKLKLPKIWGFPASDWGVAFIVLSDYMYFDNPLSKTVITTCISLPKRKSSFINKTPNESNEATLVTETFRQLRESFPNLPTPTRSILSPGVYRDGDEWRTKDTSYIFTPAGYLKKYNYQNRIYQIGTQNGKSFYSFTSMESAISNALYLLREEFNEYKNIKIEEPFTVNKIILIVAFICIIALIYYFS